MSTRQRLIESAQELLWTRGYVGMSPKAIQQLAEAGQGSMYHHFASKADLAKVAVERSAEQLRSLAEPQFSADQTALERITAYLTRERDVLRGCRIGKLSQDPEIIADAKLRRPLQETFDWLRQQLTAVLQQGQDSHEFPGEMNTADTAAMIVSVLQGGYVLARAANSDEPFNSAIRGVIALLRTQTTHASAKRPKL